MWDQYEAKLASAAIDSSSNFFGPQPPSMLDAAEHRLGLAFPPTYRRFLETLGAGNLGSSEIYGLFTSDFENSGVPDAVWETLESRRTLGLPPTMVIVYYDGSEAFHVLDTGNLDARGEAPVVIWVPGADRVETVASDFAAWFSELAD